LWVLHHLILGCCEHGMQHVRARVHGRRVSAGAVAQAQAQKAHPVVQTGRFAADMKVALINDGPITIPLRMSA
jgi:D-Tyr-tRNAtyr deacylase